MKVRELTASLQEHGMTDCEGELHIVHKDGGFFILSPEEHLIASFGYHGLVVTGCRCLIDGIVGEYGGIGESR